MSPRNRGLLYYNSTCRDGNAYNGELSYDHLERDARHELVHIVQGLADHGCGYNGLMNNCEDIFWWYLSCPEVKSARGTTLSGGGLPPANPISSAFHHPPHDRLDASVARLRNPLSPSKGYLGALARSPLPSPINA